MRKYTQEQIDWLKEFAPSHYIEECVDEFKIRYGTTITYNKMYNLLQRTQIKTLLKDKNKNLDTHKYEQEHIIWLKNNYKLYNTANDCRLAFNKHFNLNLNFNAFTHLTQRNGILFRNKPTVINDIQKQWILDNYKNYIGNNHYYTNKLCEDFYKLFNIKLTHSYVYQFLEYNGEHKPYSNPNHFVYPIGHEKFIGNQIYIKVSNDPQYVKPNCREDAKHNYRRKAHVMYEQYYNVKVNDEKQIVIHIDNNLNNFEKDNLYLLPRRAERILTGLKMKNQCKLTRLNAIKLSEILNLIKEIE